jgi:hypothetical protein
MKYLGIDRRRLDAVLRSLGGRVEVVRRTGEIRYSHPLLAESPRADGRRKDASKRLSQFVCKIEKLMVSEPANDPHWRSRR